MKANHSLNTPTTINQFSNRALILEDHRLFSDALTTLLEQMHLFSNIFSFENINELTDFFINDKEDKTNYLFADYYLGQRSFDAYINQIRHLCDSLKIIVVSSLTNPALINTLLSYRIEGIISKNDGSPTIINCIQTIKVGKTFLSPSIEKWLSNTDRKHKSPFSQREVEILSYFAQGITVDDVAEELNLSRHTIAAHRRKMMAKTKANNIIELLNVAREVGIIK